MIYQRKAPIYYFGVGLSFLMRTTMHRDSRVQSVSSLDVDALFLAKIWVRFGELFAATTFF